MKYKTEKLNNFSKGESKDIISTISDICLSHKVDISENERITLSRAVNGDEVAGLRNPQFADDPNAGYIWVAGNYDEGGGVYSARIYSISREDPDGGFVLEKNFGNGYIYGIGVYKNIVIISTILDSEDREIKWANNDDLDTWTTATGIDSGDDAVMNQMGDILDETLYIITDQYQSANFFIYKTNDGKNYEKVLTVKANSSSYLKTYKGFLYVFLDKIYRLENGKLQIIKEIDLFTSFSNNIEIFNNLIYIIYDRKILTYDGDKFEIIYKFPAGNIYYEIIGATENKLWIRHAENIYSINKNNAIIKEIETSGNFAVGYWGAVQVYDTIYLLGGSYTNTCYIYVNIGNYGLNEQGYFESRAIEGELIPKQLILKTKKLLTGETVKVYIEKNLSGSWETTPLISMTENDYIKKYNFPNNYGKLDWVRFKIELNSTIDECEEIVMTTPEIYSLSLIYLPTGLENSK